MTTILGLAVLSPLAHAYALVNEDRICAITVVSQLAPAPDAVGVPLDIEAFFQFEVGCQDSTWALELVEADTQEVVATRENTAWATSTRAPSCAPRWSAARTPKAARRSPSRLASWV